MTVELALTPLAGEGGGRPLLVVGPSLGTSVEGLWRSCAALLADRFEVVGWDLPGHGSSPATGEPFSVADLAAGLLAALGAAPPFAYAGDSLGGAVGLALLLDHPERVTGATLACTGALIGTPAGWYDRAATVRAGGTASVVDASAGRWFGPGFLDREPEVGARLLADLVAVEDESYARCCEALAGFDVRDRLGGIRGPITLVGGRHDVATPLDDLRLLRQAVDGARLLELDCGHLAPAEDPDGVAAAVALTGPRTGTSGADPTDPTWRSGMAVRRAVAGDAWVDRAVARTTGFTRDFQDFITRYAWGTIWTRPGLDRRSRSIVTLTALIARGHHDELAMHVRAAVVANGLTRDELREVLLQSAVYCGVPDANTAFRIAAAVLDELDGLDDSGEPDADTGAV